MEPPEPAPVQPVTIYPTIYATFRAYAEAMRACGQRRDAWYADAYADRLANLCGFGALVADIDPPAVPEEHAPLDASPRSA